MRGSPVSLLSLLSSLLLSSAVLAQAPEPAPAKEPATSPDTSTATPSATTPPATTPPADAAKEAAPADPAKEAAPADAATEAAPADAAKEAAPAERIQAVCGDTAALCFKNDNFALWPRLRIRTGFDYVQPDDQILYIGQNDGFFADQLRLGVDGAFRGRLRFRFILDATSILPGGGQNQPVSNLVSAARDVWVAYQLSPWLVMSAGQQFMPTDLEGTTTIVSLPFARRSVATSGVPAGKGIAVAGLSPSRQLGLVFGTGGPGGADTPKLGPVAVTYQLAISNGNGQNLLGNDNKLPAFYGRVGAGYEDLVSLGLGGRFNPRTVGSLPNLYTESDALAFADLSLHVAGIEVVAQGIYRSTSLSTLFPDPANAAGQETGLGATAWVWAKKPFDMDLFGIQPAYRISFYDPSNAFATDQLLENSVGIRWDLPVDDLRMSLFADYTFLTEIGDGVRDLGDDRVTALVQLEL